MELLSKNELDSLYTVESGNATKERTFYSKIEKEHIIADLNDKVLIKYLLYSMIK